MYITKKQLRQIFENLLNELEDEIILEHDYYWQISDKCFSDVYKEPNDFTIGQVTEDLGFLISDFEEFQLPKQYFSKLAAILRIIAGK